jgi:hypothetical protein
MPPLTNPKVLEAVKRILDGEDCHTVLTAVGLDLSENVKRNVMKKVSAARKQLDACRPPAAPELLTALQKTADVAAATAAAALLLAEFAQKAAAAAAAVPKISDVVGGRRNRKQAQAVRADRDATKKERKRRKSEAHKGATLAYQADKKKPKGDRMTAAELCQRFSVLNELSPKSELKPQGIRRAVQAGKAGESPNTQGRKPMVSQLPTRRRWGPATRRR